jgi:hypothetical protein
MMRAFGTAVRSLAGKPSAFLLALFFYLALVAVLYFFITTREATLLQLGATLLLALLAVALFFALQSVGVRYTRNTDGFVALLRNSTRDCFKLFAVTLPLLVIAVAGLFVFQLFEFLITKGSPEAVYGFTYTRIIPGIRFLFLFLALPLFAIQLWIAVTREGITAAMKGFGRSFVRAFSLKSLLTYAGVLVLFGATAYFLIFTRTPASSAWLEIGLLVFRLALAALVIFIGWLIGLGALTEATEEG